MSNILFCTLRTFSKTGGIEKVSRIISKALVEIAVSSNSNIEMISLYDKTSDANQNSYFPLKQFRGFDKHTIPFILSALRKSRNAKIILLSHVNLLAVGWLIKLLAPSKKLVLLNHGIEVWDKLTFPKSLFIKSCDYFISVSNYTKHILSDVNNIPVEKISVLNNCLDPFLPIPDDCRKNVYREKLGIPFNAKVVLTLTRISITERRKGYINVIKALADLKEVHNDVFYIIAGGYDQQEHAFIMETAKSFNLENNIRMSGFIDDNDLPGLFSASDIYVMPSKKEGFGIVFIEAMYYGLPVIGGNQDGSVDALQNGEFGIQIPPDDLDALKSAMLKIFSHYPIRENSSRILGKCGYVQYKQRLSELLQQIEARN
jgi:glycosyltransferase involved in cell wall biosynthesis